MGEMGLAATLERNSALLDRYPNLRQFSSSAITPADNLLLNSGTPANSQYIDPSQLAKAADFTPLNSDIQKDSEDSEDQSDEMNLDEDVPNAIQDDSDVSKKPNSSEAEAGDGAVISVTRGEGHYFSKYFSG